jgi:Spy/CpxP family protein refolding chaperone
MIARFVMLTLLVAGSASALQGQDKKAEDAFAKALFAPELVLKYAGEIGLKPAQRQTIIDLIKRVQGDLVGVQLEMAEPAQELLTILEQPQVDETQALSKVDRVLTLERDVKKMQLSLLIKIKNALTREQQERLKSLRRRDGGESSGSVEDANEEAEDEVQ